MQALKGMAALFSYLELNSNTHLLQDIKSIVSVNTADYLSSDDIVPGKVTLQKKEYEVVSWVDSGEAASNNNLYQKDKDETLIYAILGAGNEPGLQILRKSARSAGDDFLADFAGDYFPVDFAGVCFPADYADIRRNTFFRSSFLYRYC